MTKLKLVEERDYCTAVTHQNNAKPFDGLAVVIEQDEVINDTKVSFLCYGCCIETLVIVDVLKRCQFPNGPSLAVIGLDIER